MDARTIGEKAGPEPVEKRGRGGSRPRRPALLATCALFLGVVPAALPAVAGIVSGDAVSAVLNGVAFSAAALAIGGILVPLSGTAEVLLTRRATRRGLVAGILFLAWAITATAIVVCLVLSYPGAWLANLRLMLESGEEGRLLYPVLLLFFSLCASWMAWSAAAEWGGRAGVIAMLPYAALPSLGVLSSAQIADETRREAQAVADEARLRVVKEGRPCPLCPAGLLVAPFLAVGLGVALPASLFVKGDGAAAAAGIAIALSRRSSSPRPWSQPALRPWLRELSAPFAPAVARERARRRARCCWRRPRRCSSASARCSTACRFAASRACTAQAPPRRGRFRAPPSPSCSW